jgi:hypothetical protein
MRLYLTAAGIFAGTQVEAKRDGKGWHEEIVPTDKTGLIDYLNKLKFGDCASMVEPPQPVTAQDEQEEALGEGLAGDSPITPETLEGPSTGLTGGRWGAPGHRLAERAAFLGTSEEIALLADRIGELDGWPLGQVALAAASRLKELAE